MSIIRKIQKLLFRTSGINTEVFNNKEDKLHTLFCIVKFYPRDLVSLDWLNKIYSFVSVHLTLKKNCKLTFMTKKILLFGNRDIENP